MISRACPELQKVLEPIQLILATSSLLGALTCEAGQSRKSSNRFPRRLVRLQISSGKSVKHTPRLMTLALAAKLVVRLGLATVPGGLSSVPCKDAFRRRGDAVEAAFLLFATITIRLCRWRCVRSTFRDCRSRFRAMLDAVLAVGFRHRGYISHNLHSLVIGSAGFTWHSARQTTQFGAVALLGFRYVSDPENLR